MPFKVRTSISKNQRHKALILKVNTISEVRWEYWFERNELPSSILEIILRTLKILLVARSSHPKLFTCQSVCPIPTCLPTAWLPILPSQSSVSVPACLIAEWNTMATSKIFNVLNIISNIEHGSSFLSNQYSHLTSDIVFTFNIKVLSLIFWNRSSNFEWHSFDMDLEHMYHNIIHLASNFFTKWLLSPSSAVEAFLLKQWDIHRGNSHSPTLAPGKSHTE